MSTLIEMLKVSYISVNDWVLLSLYFLEFLISVYACKSLYTYLVTKIKNGVVSLFMLSVGVFFFFFSIQMATSVAWRLEVILNITNATYNTLKLVIWTISHFGTTVSLFLVGTLVVKRRFDIYITTNKLKGGDKDE